MVSRLLRSQIRKLSSSSGSVVTNTVFWRVGMYISNLIGWIVKPFQVGLLISNSSQPLEVNLDIAANYSILLSILK